MTATLSDVIKIMDEIAPPGLAENWDNSGLQVGDSDWPIKSIMIALDPMPNVVVEACKKNKDLLITHHPLIFKPLQRIDLSTPTGKIVQMAIENHMALFSAHTNLDSVAGGINDIIAEKIGLEKLTVLSKPEMNERFKLVVFAPGDHAPTLLNVLFKSNAGVIGEYTCCSFRNQGIGTYKPGSLAKPFSGHIEEVSHADEVRIETVVDKKSLNGVVQLLKKHHPYETMAYDVYPLLPERGDQGLGRIGVLSKGISLDQFAEHVKKILNLKTVRVVGHPDFMVEKVAICSGSGASLMGDFFTSGADVFISGDLRYHDARAAEDAGVGLMDIGHFGSEHLVVDMLSKKLHKAFLAEGLDVSVEVCDLEKDPFVVYFSKFK